MSTSRPLPVAAAWCWIAAGLVYLGTEAVSAVAFPGYSYATNYISDLGIPEVGTSGGRPIDSPLAWVMNTGFVLHGLLFAAAGVLVAAKRGTTVWRLVALLAVVHGVGNVLVGVVHSGDGPLHGIGAAMAIVGGDLAAITAGLAVRAKTSRRLGAAFVALGVVGIVSVVALVLDSGSSSVDLLPDGVWERLAVYTITAFELTLGATILARRRRSAPRAS
ncbi:DUF998 domain-containing protein [Aeromicrobium sp. Leaf350]|uniref:DUF998 domain-containing protein n=1 Tax=Aeromicrobium sp. Leaf350 TaxID=2876565 RepID=UPI001E290804|nr:DUF998 domain-containing protein [Aeromicrobium sp. Leaf350]